MSEQCSYVLNFDITVIFIETYYLVKRCGCSDHHAALLFPCFFETGLIEYLCADVPSYGVHFVKEASLSYIH